MDNVKKKGKKRDYVAFFIVSFILIFLTSSFVIENIYKSVDDIEISPTGVQMIYESSIGAIPNTETEEETETDTQTKTNETQQNTTQTDTQKTE